MLTNAALSAAVGNILESASGSKDPIDWTLAIDSSIPCCMYVAAVAASPVHIAASAFINLT
jgi:hypothetical protein